MRDILILKCMSEAPISHRRDPHSSKIHENRENSTWTVFWCYVTVFMKDWNWRSYLDMGFANSLKSIVLAAKYPCDVLSQKSNSSGELRHQGFIAFLVVDWFCYSLVTLRGVAHGEDYGLEFCGGTCSEVWQGKQWPWFQIKPIDRCYIDSLSTVLNV